MAFSNSVKTLRQMTARRMRDMWTGELTSAATAGSTIADTSRVEIDNYFVNGFVHIGLDAAAQDRRILSSITGSFEVLPDVIATAISTPYEIHKLWSVPDYNAFIADALASVGSEAVLANVDDTSLSVEANANRASGIESEYQVPTGLRYINEVWIADQNGEFVIQIPNSQVHPIAGPALRFTPWATARMTIGRDIRLLGQGIALTPRLSDSSIVRIDPDYVVTYAEMQALTPIAGGTTTRGQALASRLRYLGPLVELKRATAVAEHRALPGSIIVPT